METAPTQTNRCLDPPRQAGFLWSFTPPAVRTLGRLVFSLDVAQEGALPEPPFVVAANHYSHFDPPVVGAALDTRIRFLALEDLFGESRFLDWLTLGFGAIPTPRFSPPTRAVRTALACLDSGQNVGVFPEGTRVSRWGTLPPKRGAGWLAARAHVPLVPVAVLGTGRVFGIDNKLRRGRIRVVIGRAFTPTNEDSHTLIQRWADWMKMQVGRYPDLEPDEPPRTGLPGP